MVKLCFLGNFLLPLELRAEVLSTIVMITIHLFGTKIALELYAFQSDDPQ